MSELKMWLAVREDLALSPGKLATQAGHAYQVLTFEALRQCPETLAAYVQANMPKISVRADDLAMLERVAREAEAANIPFAVITDAGRTEIEPGTQTVCAFGPSTREALPPFLKRLRLL